MKDYAIIIPTYNGGDVFQRLLESIDRQSLRPRYKIIIDSNSSDNTINVSRNYNWQIINIKASEFNHGGTRQMGVDLLPNAVIYIFLTQDAILANEVALQNIVRCFDGDTVGAAYGRQLPHPVTGPLGAHARFFNYSEQSQLKSFEDHKKLGIKTAFISNSFAAYRRDALMSVGGFPKHVILGEDTYVAAKMLLAGWKIKYCADAQVYHSHDYNYIQEFKRYFDTGVFHAREPWIREIFGNAEGEGLKFVKSEAEYLINQGKAYLLPSAFIRTCLKYLGYRLGINEKKLPLSIKKRLSMHKAFWDQ